MWLCFNTIKILRLLPNSLYQIKSKIMRLLSIILLCFKITFCFAQQKQFEVTYKKTFLINFDEKNKAKNSPEKNKALGILEKVNKELENKEFKLWFNDEVSCFKEIKKMNLENKSDMFSMIAKGPGLTEGVFFTDKKLKQLIQQKTFDSKKYIIYYTIDNLIWKMTKESKRIDNYIAYKATTTRKRVTRSGLKDETITVWYTTEIPTSFGPAGFNNLPGLILEIQLGKLSLYASKIEFNKEIDIHSLKPNKGKKISKEDFIKLELKQIKN